MHRALTYVAKLKRIRRNWRLWLILLPPLVYLVVFKYVPLYGLQIAFKDFYASRGIWGSPWVGFARFRQFFGSYYFLRVLKNTVGLSFYQIFVGFPFPIILAISLNEMRVRRYRRVIQMVTYMPHFISMVVLVSMIQLFLNPHFGFIPILLERVGIPVGNPLGVPQYFKTIFVFSGIWQNMGYQSIIYMAALSTIDPTLHEAAIIDGATRMQRIRHIDIPGILPTAVIILILRIGKTMQLGFEKVYAMQNPVNLIASETIATYVYKIGLLQADYSYAAAIGLFNNVVNLVLILLV
ncbi:MAG: sugar ABC transporter permease, partial [Spirochaetaceae bacterium]|nr:sugar ABC transporter permease [Spirochaetaceae bacterium]